MLIALAPSLYASSNTYNRQPTSETRVRERMFSADSLPTAQSDNVTPGQYWFQVGAYAANANGNYGRQFGLPVTGASVEIRIKYYQHGLDSDLGYWVGLDLPGDSFIQVGYKITLTDSYPHWFWEYFPHDADSPPSTCRLTCPTGDDLGPNGTWYKFSLEASGKVWFAFVNGEPVGSVDLGVSDSGANGPYASAEVAGTRFADTVLGPVEFRNLEYRDTSGQWHMASSAVSLCCYSLGSDSYNGKYPYGIVSVPGENNYWLAGSNLNNPIQHEGGLLWPWYQVNIEGLPTGVAFADGWYLYNTTIDLPNIPEILPITASSRYVLEGWYANGVLLNAKGTGTFSATGNLTLKPFYVKQWLLQVNSNIGAPMGSGWYDDGAIATVRVNPPVIREAGFLGDFGVSSVLTGWTGDYAGPVVNGESMIHVKSPMTITAVWTTNYGMLPYYTLLIPVIAITCLSVSLEYRRRTKKPRTTEV